MKRSQLVPPGAVQRMLLSAREAWKKRDCEQTLQILERAHRLAPANVTVLLQLGWFKGLQYDYAAAERWFEQAFRVAPNKTATLAMAGECGRDFRNLELAEHYFSRAAQQPDATPEILVQHAEFCERARRTDQARALVQHALTLNPSCSLALLAQARLDRLDGKLVPAENAIRILLDQPDPGARPSPARTLRIRAWYELGAILDRQKRFDDAMTAFDQAKSMLRLHATEERAGLKVIRDRLKRLRETITPEILQRWTNAAPQLTPSPPLALLAGHPRSGTTLLEQVLDSHPQILSAEETTIFHDNVYLPLTRGFPDNPDFLPVLEAAQTATLQSLRNSYFATMQLALGKPIGHHLLIDKNPSYTFLIPTLVRVFPEIKLLIALRDPRDVVMSCFMQAFVPVGQTTAAYLSLDATVEEYVQLMSMWTTLAPALKDSSLEIRYEEMVDDLPKTARRVLEFLGIAWDENVLHFDEHARQKMVRSPTYADVIRPVFKSAVGRWRNYQKFLEPHLPKLEPLVKTFGY